MQTKGHHMSVAIILAMVEAVSLITSTTRGLCKWKNKQHGISGLQLTHKNTLISVREKLSFFIFLLVVALIHSKKKFIHKVLCIDHIGGGI